MSAPHELMGELPHLSVFSSYLAQAEKTVQEYQRSITFLRKEIEASKVPTLFVEGTSDATVFKKAWEMKYGHIELNIISCGGTDNMMALSKPGQVLTSISKSDYVFALVDNDAAGRDIYKNKRLKPEGGNWLKDSRNGVYWCRLAVHDEFKAAMSHFDPSFRTYFWLFQRLTAIGHSDLLLSFAGRSSWPLPLSLSVTSITLVWLLHFAKNWGSPA